MNEEGVAESEEIRRCLDVVMGEEEKAVEIRSNAKKWKEGLPNRILRLL